MYLLVFQELQNEVSSLLEFKNALLETFPHLHNRFGGSVSPSSGGLAAPTPIPGSTSPMKPGLGGIMHSQHHTSSNPNMNNAISSSTPIHSQRIASPSPAGIGRMSSPGGTVGPNHLNHYNPSSSNGSSRQQQPNQTGFENLNQHNLIDHPQQDLHDNSWDQNHHQPHHNQSGLVQVPSAAHGPVVIGSSNTGTLPRRPGGSKPPVVIRKSPENSNSSSVSGGVGGGNGGGGGIAADSGFNSETKDMMIPLSSNGIPPTLIR